MEMNAGALMIDEYKNYIERDFPNFPVADIRYLGSGWDNAAFLVNSEYVFRFLRGLFDRSYPLKTEEIQKEVNILNHLQGKVSFAVPKPDFVGRYFSYFGYKLIPGTLWDKAKDQLSDEYIKSWVATRSEISKAISPKDATDLKIPTYQTAKNQQFVQQFLNDNSADPRVKQIAKEAMDYIMQQLASNQNWVFIHEDLQMSNCMVDEQSKKITGVIDWLEAEVGPVEAEFYFWSKYGRDVLEKAANFQKAHDGTEINTSLAFAIHQFYITADFVDFTNRGFEESAARKWQQIEAYL